MGCFSFLCKNSGKPALSTSFSGSPCKLYLLKNGKVLEMMHGNYDSYGRVFTKGLEDSFKWRMEWGDVCDLMFDSDMSNGIAVVLDKYDDGTIPTTRSENDPNQGWGDDGEGMGDCSKNGFELVGTPFHKVFD